ncbi:hypothetical protein SAMN05660477_03100 [Soonwooa buanensis]|uniref:Uncharacterized protein n=1 Tax=Soonwooa buanensis TaxID=619805 RepID=A0A1T5GSK6_9FLAO|nr:hypothetical protein SAMN05660477_03100 [Soonwooa buanensis]
MPKGMPKGMSKYYFVKSTLPYFSGFFGGFLASITKHKRPFGGRVVDINL